MTRSLRPLRGMLCAGWLGLSSLWLNPIWFNASTLAGAAGGVLVACRKDDGSIAKLDRVAGTVQGQKSAGVWQEAPLGTSFSMGDAVRTQAASSAGLALFEGSRLSLEPSTVVRFSVKASAHEGPRLDVELGQAMLETGDEALKVEMQMGTALVGPNSKLRLTRSGPSTRIEVVIGSARLLSAFEAFELRMGEAIDITSEGAFRRASSAAPSVGSALPHAPSASPSDVREVLVPGGSIVLQGPAAEKRPSGPELVDFAAVAGESFVIHDPSPPAAVALSQDTCALGAVFILDPNRQKPDVTQGGARVSILVPAGVHRYEIRCREADGTEGRSVAQGSISVLADDGSRKLASSAPVTQVDTDGRRYTVLYQGHLPRLDVQWPRPPEAASYTLHVLSSRGARSFSANAARYMLPSGALSEGEHSLTFEGGGRRSKRTDVVLRFDNAAPSASISSPKNRGFAPGSRVHVAGVALPGSAVFANGQKLTLDEQARFAEDITLPAGVGVLWIRFSHPKRGVHYYLRRSGQ